MKKKMTIAQARASLRKRETEALAALTPAMEERIGGAMRRTWSAIGEDALQMFGSRGSMKRDDVISTVLDASYIVMYGGDAEAARIAEALDAKVLLPIGRRYFKSDRYSL